MKCGWLLAFCWSLVALRLHSDAGCLKVVCCLLLEFQCQCVGVLVDGVRVCVCLGMWLCALFCACLSLSLLWVFVLVAVMLYFVVVAVLVGCAPCHYCDCDSKLEPQAVRALRRRRLPCNLEAFNFEARLANFRWRCS